MWLIFVFVQKFTAKEYKQLPPGLPRKALGKCAIVGHSDRLLAQNRGSEIDGHTTVIRTGFFLHQNAKPSIILSSAPPLSGFEMHVGQRTDFVFLPSDCIYEDVIPRSKLTKMWQTMEWQVFSHPLPYPAVAGNDTTELWH